VKKIKIGTATDHTHVLYTDELQLIRKSASRKFLPATLRHATNLIAALVTTG
jgi:hypothetical protein